MFHRDNVSPVADLKVDVHLKPDVEEGVAERDGRSGQGDVIDLTRGEGLGGVARKDDVVIVVEGSPRRRKEEEEEEEEDQERRDSMERSLQEHSLGSVTSSVTTSTSGLPSQRLGGAAPEKDPGGRRARGSEPRRRFSNLSNLAQSLPSSTSGSMAFPAVAAAGSLDLQAEEGGSRARRRGDRRRGGGSHRNSADGGENTPAAAAGTATATMAAAVAAAAEERQATSTDVGVRRTRSAMETRPTATEERHFLVSLKKTKKKDGGGASRERRAVDDCLVPGDCDSEEDDGKSQWGGGRTRRQPFSQLFFSSQVPNLHF